MAARNDPEQGQESLAEGASIPSSANQTNELHDPNFKSETFLHTLGKTAQERHESILANRHEKAEWNVETFDEFQKLSVTNQKMAWTLHKNILQDYLAPAEDSNSILAEKNDAILQLQELIQSNEQQITEQCYGYSNMMSWLQGQGLKSALHFEHHFYEALAHTQSNMSVVSSKGKTPTMPTSSQRSKPENEEMPDAPTINELKETLRVKLPDTYSGNRKELEVFLLQVELYQHFNDEKFPTQESYAL
ncbi:hypothetical protein VC83_08020 [Pseudogymnoascus destructans]|uniref:Uncharacterized protein n=1 Tax=Pseudogymnoascus destructans TaxID=655981 RepID=A0A177A1I3_9PEZI|nr:uncharacterized protein VC83_08020 [Pseudogymnoascus destructans]OAF55947.1 hypothetical protein VC83_08020 [Pseudogymnoascus destructans]